VSSLAFICVAFFLLYTPPSFILLPFSRPQAISVEGEGKYPVKELQLPLSLLPASHLSFNTYEPYPSLIDTPLTVLKWLEDKMILTKVHLSESKVHRGVVNWVKAIVYWSSYICSAVNAHPCFLSTTSRRQALGPREEDPRYRELYPDLIPHPLDFANALPFPIGHLDIVFLFEVFKCVVQ